VLPPTPVQPVPPPQRRLWPLWVGAAALVLAFVLLLVWRRPSEPPVKRLAAAPSPRPPTGQNAERSPSASTPKNAPAPATGAVAVKPEQQFSLETGVRFAGPGDAITAAFSRDGQQLLALFTGTINGPHAAVQIWDLKERRKISECFLPSYLEHVGDFSPDRRRVLVRSLNAEGVTVVDVSTCTQVQHLDSVWAKNVLFASNGKDAFVEGSRDRFGPSNEIEVWELDRMKVKHKRRFTGLRAWGTTLAADPRGQWLAFLGGDGNSGPDRPAVSAWDVALERELWQIDEGYGPTSQGLAVSPDGRQLLVGHRDKVDLLQMPKGEQVSSLACPEANIYGVAFSPDGRLILGAGSGFALCVWELAGRRLLAKSKGTWAVSAGDVAFSPSGEHFLMTAVGDAVYVFPTPR